MIILGFSAGADENKLFAGGAELSSEFGVTV